MKYQRKMQTVDAVQLKQHTVISTPQGKMHGEGGDYLVTEGNQQKIVEKNEFEREWQQAPQGYGWTWITPNWYPQVNYPVLTYEVKSLPGTSTIINSGK